jgi:hypothetical protein
MKRINEARASVRDTKKSAFMRQSEKKLEIAGEKGFSRAASKGRKSKRNVTRSNPLTVS